MLCSTLLFNFIKFKGDNYENSNASFLFFLRNKDGFAPFFANIKQGQEQKAIYCYSSRGPTFGGGHDLYICNNPQVNQSRSNFGHSYQLPTGYVYGSEQAKNLLAGQYHFLTTEIEVFNWNLTLLLKSNKKMTLHYIYQFNFEVTPRKFITPQNWSTK